jgi:hypothetical protein
VRVRIRQYYLKQYVSIIVFEMGNKRGVVMTDNIPVVGGRNPQKKKLKKECREEYIRKRVKRWK